MSLCRTTITCNNTTSPAGIHQINDSQLVTTGADGALMVWDVRNPGAGPVKFAVPDRK